MAGKHSLSIEIKGAITIDDRMAEMLQFLTSYGLFEIFETKCSNKYSKEQFEQILRPLRDEVNLIVSVRDEAIKAVNEKLMKSRTNT